MNSPIEPRVQSRLLRVFVLQLALISFATVAGVTAASLVAERILVKQALSGEAEYFWKQRAQDANFPVPSTLNLQGYLDSDGNCPEELKNLPVGQQRVQFRGDELIAYNSKKDGQSLVLLFQDETVSNLGLLFGVVPLTLVLLVMYALAYLTYVLSKKAVSPIAKLAGIIERFDFNSRDATELDLSTFTGQHNSETLILADALNHFIARTNQSLERERNFARYASHELRTPLAVIDGSVSSLALLDLQGAPARAVARIERASKHMLDMISTLLLLARDKRTEDSTMLINVNDMVDDLVSELPDIIEMNGISISTHHHDDLLVTANDATIRIVIGNILRNACLYTVNGAVDIYCTASQITVSDNGPGLTADEQRRIFEPFFRIDDSNNSKGTGLGLALVKTTCDNYGWVISVNSTVGSGSNFTIRFNNPVTRPGNSVQQ